jgi:hypothetical protein
VSRPKVFLHVGEPKSGTTYLQEIVWRNREVLRRQGLRLPGAGVNDHFRAAQDLRDVAQPADDPAPPWRGEWDELAREILRGPGAALISQEHLCGATEAQVMRAMHSLLGAEVHVVLTVRDFASLLPAEWQETVKHRNGRAWHRWLADIAETETRVPTGSRARWFWTAHDTTHVLRRWTSALPAERVHVVTVPQSREHPQLLWERFASVLDVDAASVDTTDVRSNATLGVVETELLRRLNLRLSDEIPQWYYVTEVKEHLAQQVLAARAAGARPQLPEKYAAWAQDRSAHVVASLVAQGYDIVGDLADLHPARTDAATPATPTSAQLLDAALDALAGVVRDQYRGRSTAWRGLRMAHLVPRAAAPRVRRTARRLAARLR